MASIFHVRVSFETNEERLAVTIIDSVVSYDEDDNEITSYDNMIGMEFCGDNGDNKAINHIAKVLNVSKDIIEIDNELMG